MNKQEFDILVKNKKALGLSVDINGKVITSHLGKLKVWGVFKEDCIELYEDDFLTPQEDRPIITTIYFKDIDYVELYLDRSIGFALQRLVHFVFTSKIIINKRDGTKYLFDCENIKVLKVIQEYLNEHGVITEDSCQHLDYIDLSLTERENYDYLWSKADEFITKK